MRNTTLALLSLAALCSCATPGDPLSPPDSQPWVLAYIDGEPVSMVGYRGWIADVNGVRAEDEYLGICLLENEARRHGITVSEKEIDTALENLWAGWIKDRLHGDPGALDAELAGLGHDRASYRRWFHWQKRRELMASRLIHLDRRIDEEALQRRFEQLYGPKGVRTQVRLLVLTRARMSQELRQQSGSRVLTAAELDDLLMEKALALRARVEAGESFESVVRAESDDLAVRKDGGLCSDEQWRLRGAAFVRAAESAAVHVVQAPVPNSSGIDLFEVVSRVVTRIEDVRESLKQAMLGEPATLEEVTALDQRLRAASKIEKR